MDAGFDTQRDAALAGLNALKPALDAAWEAGDAPAYPRGIGATKLAKPRWAKDDKDAGEAAWAVLKAAIKDVDARHNAALWDHVRSAFDYPVFVASPKAVGITSTGETEGAANDLPGVLEAWRSFQSWLGTGAKPEEMPDFHLPFAA